jgi:hypothetical protein
VATIYSLSHKAEALEALKRLKEGDDSSKLGNYEKSASCYYRAMNIAEELSEDELFDRRVFIAACNAGLSGALGSLGQPEEALVRAEKALSFYTRAGAMYPAESSRWFIAMFNKGALLAHLGHSNEALNALQQAKAMLSASLEADKWRSMCEQNIQAIMTSQVTGEAPSLADVTPIELLQRQSARTSFRTAGFLGLLAGGSIAVVYLIPILIYALSYALGYIVYLGGSAIIINGTPRVELPPFVQHLATAVTPLWGIFLSRISPSRPKWWKAAPLMWISLIASLVIGYILLKLISTLPFTPLLTVLWYAIFGLFLGFLMSNRWSPLLLFFACPLTNFVALMLSSLLPIGWIVGTLTNLPTNINYHISVQATDQAAIWLFHGFLMGIVIWLLESYKSLRSGQHHVQD